MPAVVTHRSDRRLDIDWLRIGATWLLFPFHVGKIFDYPPFYHIKNETLSVGMGFFTGFVHQWHMRLFFFLAGWSILGSLARRGPRRFVAERSRRLLIPFVMGSLLLCPFLRWAELRHGLAIAHDGTITRLPGPGPGFLEFLPRFFTLEGFSWAHLWFLIYLYVFSLLWLPLFERLRRASRELHSVGTIWAYAPMLPLALIEVILRGRWPGIQNLYDDWANFCFYSLLLVLGFVAARQPAFERVLHREWLRAGAVGLAACGALMTGWAGLVEGPVWLGRALGGVAAWGCVVGLLGFGSRYLRSDDGTVFRYLRESAYPIYVLHSPAIVLVAHFVVPGRDHIALEFAVILLGAVALSLAVYEFAVRRLAVLRVLFGLAPANR